MIEADGPIVTLDIPMFTEAPWVHKRGNTYYLTYATEFPEKFAYATADKITGPWTVRGLFKGLAENCNTNHHAIVDFKGRSYLVYHNGALPKGGNYRRSVCIDYLDYNADGTIRMVTETKEGVKAAPVVTLPVHRQTATLGAPLSLTATTSGSAPFTYQWFKDGTPVPGAINATLAWSALAPQDLGTYTVVVTDANGGLASADTPVSLGQAGRLINLSVRSLAASGSDTLIVGFVIFGDGPKPMMVRGIGPTLANFSVSGVLADPKLDLYSGSNVIGANDAWKAGADVAGITAFGGDKFGPYPLSDKDAVLLQAVNAGPYTAHLTGVGGATGVALVEVYDADRTDPSAPEFAAQPKLVNLSARSRVGTGDGILISGFVVNGSLPKRVMLRGIGPTLQKFNVTGVLPDPDLQLFSGNNLIKENRTWAASEELEEIYAANGHKFGSFLLDSREAILVATLPPGPYTVHVRGADNATGVGLVEVYELP